jgi:hypothetical protein
MIKIDGSTKNQVENLHKLTIKMLLFTLAMEAESVPVNLTADTLANPYKGKIPLARVNAFQEPFASCQVIQKDTPNTRTANQYLEYTETGMKYSFSPIVTE